MSITSSTGLVSGLPTGQIINSLMAIEQQPVTNLQTKNKTLQAKEAAYQSINANLLNLKSAADQFTQDTTFQTTTATSSNQSVLSATTDAAATPGTYSFTVQQLVSAQQMVTKGFRDTASTPVGAGTLSFDRIQSRLDSQTQLSDLNGGSGFARGAIRITDRSGATATVDLSTAVTVNDVIKKINNAQGINVTASIQGDHLLLTDGTGQTASDIKVTNAGSAKTAESLGLTAAASGNTLTGNQINNIGNATLLSSLNDHLGIRNISGVPDFKITDSAGNSFSVDISSALTVGDLIKQIDSATGGKVTAAVDSNGTGLKLTDTTGGGSGFSVTAINGSNAAADLGIAGTDTAGTGTLGGKRLIASMDSKLISKLNGGQGVNLGDINVTNASGVTTNVDLSKATSVSDIIDTINNAGAGVTASLNNAGDGISVTDTSGGTGSLVIADGSTGSAATGLHLAGTFSTGTANSGNLQLQYVNDNTALADLGVTKGKFQITDSTGASATINLTGNNITTVGDVINQINSSGLAVTASVNQTGDGILLTDTGSGSSAMQVQEDGSTTAASLGLLQTAASPGANINGSFEKHVDISATDTLQNVADKINNANVGVTANIINDGSQGAPYRLSLTSNTAGSLGAFTLNSGSVNLGATTLTQAHDAQVFFGSTNPQNAVVISSKTNTLKNIIPGATVNLNSASDQPVTLSISQDNSGIETAIQNFVKGFNSTVDSINQQDTYDSQTQQAGLLLGDGTAQQITQAMYSAVINGDNQLSGQYKSLSQIGITVDSSSHLQFNQSKFEQALQTNYNAVKSLFTYKQTSTDSTTGTTTTTASGIGVRISDMLKHLTDPVNGVLQNQVNSLQDQVNLNNDRITTLNALIADKRTRLQNEFNNMEQSLAQLQSQSGYLSNIGTLGTSSSGSSSSSGSTSSGSSTSSSKPGG